MRDMKMDLEKVRGICKEEAPSKRCYDCQCNEEECAVNFINTIIETYNIKPEEVYFN